MGNLIVQQREATAYLEDQLEKVQLIRNLETVLKDGISCQKTLQGVLIPKKNKSVKISAIKDNTGNVLYKSNSKIGHLKVGDIKVLNQSVLLVNSSGFVEIEVPLSRIRKGGGPQAFQSYRTKLSITVDKSKKATSCFNPSDPGNVFKTVKHFTKTECHRLGHQRKVTVQCGKGYSLLNCTGSPGIFGPHSRFSRVEYSNGRDGGYAYVDTTPPWSVKPNYSKNTCTLNTRGGCLRHIESSYLRSTAICYKNGE